MSPEQLVQLFLILPAGLSLHFQQVSLQQAWIERGEDVSTLLQVPGRLLLTKLSYWTSNADRLPTVLCVFTGPPRTHLGYNFDRSANRDCQMVFGISPAHVMYHSSETNNVERALDIRKEAENIHLCAGSLKMEFTNELRSLRFMTGSLTADCAVEGFEIWTF
jgi:hypothetical protein